MEQKQAKSVSCSSLPLIMSWRQRMQIAEGHWDPALLEKKTCFFTVREFGPILSPLSVGPNFIGWTESMGHHGITQTVDT